MTSKTLVLIPIRSWVWCAVAVIMLSMCGFVQRGMANMLEMTDLVAHPEVYDRKVVVVIGQVKNVQSVIDSKGQPMFKFLLADGVGTLKVISRTKVAEGDQIIVEGTFTRKRQGGRIVVYNEVVASSIKPVNQFDVDLVG